MEFVVFQRETKRFTRIAPRAEDHVTLVRADIEAQHSPANVGQLELFDYTP